jgi:NADH-quinone oxidoreductase subunit L
VGWATGKIIRLQTGYVYHYAFAMLIGVALIVTWFAWPTGLGPSGIGAGIPK